MRIPLLVALLGATAMLPATANAQDRHDRSDHHEARGQGDRGHHDAGDHRGGDQGHAQRGQSQGYHGYQGQRQSAAVQHRGYSPQHGRSDARFDHGRPAIASGYGRGRADYHGQRDRRYGGGYDRRPDYRGGHDRGEGYRGGYNDHGRYNRDWRRDDRYDWRGYRSSNRYAYRLPRYYSPRGWSYGYRRFGVGLRLNSVLFGENYWIGDPYAYRLPPAYGPYRWVRYYNDALLVDVRRGTVVDAVYGIFW